VGALAFIAAIALLPAMTCKPVKDSAKAALILDDLRDAAESGTVYALAENSKWRINIALVQKQLEVASTQTNTFTYNDLVAIMHRLPVKELKSSEALLTITLGKIVLRHAGKEVELGNVKSMSLLAGALSEGMKSGLVFAPY
jgi:hypothetical protein